MDAVVPQMSSLDRSRSQGWIVESLRRSDPNKGPDTWLVIGLHNGITIFGAGLDEEIAWHRALATQALNPLPRLARSIGNHKGSRLMRWAKEGLLRRVPA